MFGMSQKVTSFFCASLNLKEKHIGLSKRINILDLILNFIGVYKKLTIAPHPHPPKSPKINCELVGAWTHSISNYVYWCSASSNGDNDLILEKWISVLNHVTDIQHLYPKYLHGLLDDRQIKNVGRPQSKTKDAEKQYSVSYPKGRQGEGVSKEAKVEQTFSEFNIRCIK